MLFTDEPKDKLAVECLKIAERNARDSILLRLPGEIRTLIYEFVVYEGKYRLKFAPLQVFDCKCGSMHTKKAYWLANRDLHKLALLRVSRQIYAETHDLPFRLNKFALHDKTFPIRDYLVGWCKAPVCGKDGTLEQWAHYLGRA
ncbi:hypothetical protein N0V90_012975 [Kalmusia sp. IMI 367209]|nr:hypothetical protein N0V90_012975 [Kalmusia sp. IMI 367209]